MPKPPRKAQQHRRQTPARRRSYTVGGQGAGEQYKPPFPMSLLQNQKLFWIVGGVVMVLAFFVAAFGQSCNPNRDTTAATPVPSSTPSGSATPDGSQTAAASPTANPRKFSQADQVIDPATKTYTATIKTDKGDIVLKLLADQAPKTVNTFVFLAEKHYFDGITFHRVIPNFVIQAGDPTGTGTGGPGFQTEEDQNDLKNTRGMVSMAKAGAVTEFGSQFFINLKDNPALDEDSSNQKRFYPWAEVTSGMDVADAISKVPADGAGKPTTPVTIQSVTIKTTPK